MTPAAERTGTATTPPSRVIPARPPPPPPPPYSTPDAPYMVHTVMVLRSTMI